MLVGEAPGEMESRMGLPFVGKSGDELSRLYLPIAQLTRSRVYITNVYKYRPPNNRDPNDDEIAEGLTDLLTEIAACQPKFIVALGNVAARVFGMDVPMSWGHGLPFRWGQVTVIPCYHPAAGLHDNAMMTEIMQDFAAVSRVIYQGWRPQYPHYQRVYRYNKLPSTIPDVIGVDTETIGLDGDPHSLQIAVAPGEAYLVPIAGLTPSTSGWLRDIAASGTLWVFHNAKYDLKVCHKLGIYPKNWTCTMQMAYLLQDEPLALKALAYRHLGIKMSTYKDVIGTAGVDKMIAYLQQVVDADFPRPEPHRELARKDGYSQWKTVKPTSISSRAKALVKAYGKDNGIDLVERWNQWEDKATAEAVLGKFPEPTIADVSIEALTSYACADADATLQVYYILRDRITKLQLDRTLEIDLACIPMVVDMELAGTRINRGHYEAFGEQVAEKSQLLFDELQSQCAFDGYFKHPDQQYNPNSNQDCADLCAHLGIHAKSTEAKYLEPFAKREPILATHLEYKRLMKLKSTYIDNLLAMADPSDRIHTSFSVTRTGTGRLASSNPNLQNIPVRTKDGENIRRGFVAG